MSNAAIASEMNDEMIGNQRILMQLGFIGLLFFGLILIADTATAHGTCSGFAALTGPLLPAVV